MFSSMEDSKKGVDLRSPLLESETENYQLKDANFTNII